MGVPDQTYFGRGLDGKSIRYGEVRAVKDEQDRILLVKNRLEALFISQNERIAERDEPFKPKIWSPFSLCVLTLLGIETLGYVIGDIDKIENEGEQEKSKKIVTPIYQLLNKELARKPSKKFIKGFCNLHGKSAKNRINKYSDIFHKFQRNTFNHGFQSRGVYLNHKLSSVYQIDEDEGVIIVNPYLFWDRFAEVYNEVFEEIISKPKDPRREYVLKYLNRLLD